MTGYDELYRCEQLSLCGHNSTVACPFLRHGRRTTEPRCAGRTALLDRMGGRLRRLPVRLTTAWVQALRARASLWHRTRPCCAQAATLQPSPAALHLLIPRGPPDPSNTHFRTPIATTPVPLPPPPPPLPPHPPTHHCCRRHHHRCRHHYHHQATTSARAKTEPPDLSLQRRRHPRWVPTGPPCRSPPLRTLVRARASASSVCDDIHRFPDLLIRQRPAQHDAAGAWRRARPTRRDKACAQGAPSGRATNFNHALSPIPW